MGANVSQPHHIRDQLKDKVSKHSKRLSLAVPTFRGKSSSTSVNRQTSHQPNAHSDDGASRTSAKGDSAAAHALQVLVPPEKEEKAEPPSRTREEERVEAGPGIATESSDQTRMPTPLTTVPCQYRTGRTLGSGTYAIVKEAIHVKTGKYYACKVINKKLMEGREHMVRNEIAVLKKISSGHPNIVTLHDYFETAHNLYLCFDLCTGGELFDSICARGQYNETDAAGLVRTIFTAVEYLHECGIVHRDLKPENLLFRTKGDRVEDIMIADFGLSRIMEENKLTILTEICGTPGYMAPEIFKKTGHGKPVDVWAMGVITYFLLAGYTPFDRDTQRQEMEAIIAGDYRFQPEEYWCNVSTTARSFVSECLTIDPVSRPTASECLKHPWLTAEKPHFVESETGEPRDLLPHVKKAFDARRTFRKAVLGMMAMKRLGMAARHHLSPEAQRLGEDVFLYQQESEKEIMEDTHIIHHHNDTNEEVEHLKQVDDISINHAGSGKGISTGEATQKLAAMNLDVNPDPDVKAKTA